MKHQRAVDLQWCEKAFNEGLKPESQQTVSETARRKRILPDTSAEPGPYVPERTIYMMEPMDCCSVSSPIEMVVIKKGAQLGGSEVGLNFFLHIVLNAPGTTLIVYPTHDASQRNVRLRIDPMINACPELSARITRRRRREGGDTASLKKFPGGMAFFVGANSPSSIRSTPVRFVILEEPDAYPSGTEAGGEGDIVQLAIARTPTFRGRRKILMISTPTLEGMSRVDQAFKDGDQRYFMCSCPHCGHEQRLVWQQVHWLGEDRAHAFYTCASCGSAIDKSQKRAMVQKGHWVATAKSKDGKTASFHISALYSPFLSLGDIAIQHASCGNDASRLQVFWNTMLGECWQDTVAAPLDPVRIMSRASSWGSVLPDQVVLLTCGIDVQQTYLSLELVGWSANEESWSIAYRTLPGNPGEQQLWDHLDEILRHRFPHRKLGTLPIACVCIDSGNWSKFVYAFTGRRFHRRIFAIKGSSDPAIRIWPQRPSRPSDGRESALFVVGSTAAKEVVVSRLRIETPGPGFCHFPDDRDLDFYEQLTAEKPIRKIVRGEVRRVWVRPPHARNEALDCRVYALCALHAIRSYGFDLNRETARVMAIREEDIQSKAKGTLAARFRTLMEANNYVE